MNIPSTIRAGDTWEWTDSDADHPAPTWTLKYVLYRYGQAVITLTATASSADHAVAVASATTAAYPPGVWEWTAYAEKGVGASYERETIDTGQVTIKPNVVAAILTTDLRSHAQKVLDAIEAVIEGRASHAELSLTVNGKAIQYLKPDELIRWRSVYQRQVNREKGVGVSVRYSFGSG